MSTAGYPLSSSLSNQLIRAYQAGEVTSHRAAAKRFGVSRNTVKEVIQATGCQRTKKEILALPHVRERQRKARAANLVAKFAEADAYIGKLCQTATSVREVTAQVNQKFELSWTEGNVWRRMKKAGHHLAGKVHCIGLTPDTNNILVQCPELFTPYRVGQQYHSTACYSWTFNRLQLGYRLDDVYVKGAHTKRYPPEVCKKGWTIRDGILTACTEPFVRNSRTVTEYHSPACRQRTRRWKSLGYHLTDSVRRQCAYRNCAKGEGGTRKRFDRVKRSPTGEYFCCHPHVAREREARATDRLLADARAEALTLFADRNLADWPGKPEDWLPIARHLLKAKGHVPNKTLAKLVGAKNDRAFTKKVNDIRNWVGIPGRGGKRRKPVNSLVAPGLALS
jgi:transposase